MFNKMQKLKGRWGGVRRLWAGKTSLMQARILQTNTTWAKVEVNWRLLTDRKS